MSKVLVSGAGDGNGDDGRGDGVIKGDEKVLDCLRSWRCGVGHCGCVLVVAAVMVLANWW